MTTRTPKPSALARGHWRQKASMRAYSRMSMLLLGNESWEFFDGIPKHYSLRTRVRMKLRLSTFGFAWEICQTVFALVASTLYVVQTYQPDFDTDSFDLAALVVFSVDYVLNVYCAESRLRFLVSFTSIMDVVTILPAAAARITQHPTKGNQVNNVGTAFPFLRFIRVLRLLRLTRLIRAAGSRSSSAVQKQMHTIVLLITCIVFISAGVFHAVESANRTDDQPSITFGDALYYLMVTMSTVGYGDIAPMTSIGKVVAAAVIIVSFTVIPRELTRLTQLMNLQSQFRRFYHPSAVNPHILVIGHITDARTLLDFFKEMYHPDRQLDNSSDLQSIGSDPITDPPCVLMGPHEPSESILNLLNHPLLQNRVTFIKGSVMSEEDLCRVGADAARACFVLVPKSSANPKQTDAETVLRLLAIRNYNPTLEIYTQMLSPGYSDYISEVDADHVLCIDEIKMSLMAKSCLCSGLATLVSNLFSSSSVSNSTSQAASGWQKEYVKGVAMEVYAAKLPTAFYGLSFAQACEVLYQCSHGEVILMGVFEPSQDEPLGRRIHPAGPGAASPKRSQGAQLPHLKVHSMRPRLVSMSSRSSLRGDDADDSQMYVNPGHDVRIGSGQIVYVISESKRLTQTQSISHQLKEWLTEGNTLPLPLGRTMTQDTRPSGSPRAVAALAQISPLMPPPYPRRRTQSDVLLEEAVHPDTNLPIENHIVVVTDLDAVAMHTFVHLLRLRHHTPGRADYHAIVFLSWADKKSIAGVCRVLQEYDDVFLMVAHQDNSKAEFFRANILQAARCVLLSDKASIKELDGETIDAQTIFHYLAILSIQSEFGVDTTSGLTPIVELTMPRTMKILDTALSKRTIRSYIHRQKINAIVRRTGGSIVPTEPHEKHPHKKLRTKKLVQQLVQQGADSLKLRKQLQLRHMSIRKQDASVNRSTSFDASGSALLPFFAAGYGFSDDVFDNMLCQSYYTPGLVRFIYALLFSENGRTCRRPGSALASIYANEGLQGQLPTVDGLYSDDDGDDDDDDVDRADEADGRHSVVASSIVQVPVPAAFVLKTFGEMFLHLIAAEQVVAIALYRGRGEPFSLPYVASGPSSDTILMKDDLVFVLAQPAAHKRLDPALRSPRSESGASPVDAQLGADDAPRPARDERGDATGERRTVQQLVLHTDA